ncbi:hypothetical protein ONE63_007172 [Megalurothrips usitatus]|uniref:Uncharacterized protein n=1 Tax=Megalurothrips usitatus TaxID=439358 RepID=A0AAV7XY63_9NEOP|nr:hypothetical protein ONE63_007172 [Megalurothrips usitatus]
MSGLGSPRQRAGPLDRGVGAGLQEERHGVHAAPGQDRHHQHRLRQQAASDAGELVGARHHRGPGDALRAAAPRRLPRHGAVLPAQPRQPHLHLQPVRGQEQAQAAPRRRQVGDSQRVPQADRLRPHPRQDTITREPFDFYFIVFL